MELGTSIRKESNVTIIPEMILSTNKDVNENENENVKSAMFFLVNTFPYMRMVLELLYNFIFLNLIASKL